MVIQTDTYGYIYKGTTYLVESEMDSSVYYIFSLHKVIIPFCYMGLSNLFNFDMLKKNIENSLLINLDRFN